MNWRSVAILPLMVALAACASEGGSRGSGIATALEGNVASVQTAALPAARGNPPRRAAGLRTLMAVEAAARAQTAIEGITVAVAGTTLSDLTDANGRFS